MEEICESPKVNSDQDIFGRLAMAESLKPFFEENTIGGLQVRIIGWSKRLHSAIRRCSNRNPRSLEIIQPMLSVEELNVGGPECLIFL